MLNLGFETTADVHVMPAHAVRHVYGAVDLSTAPSPTVVSEIVVDDSDVECDDAKSNVAPADDRPQVGDTSIQRSGNVVLVPVDQPAPDEPAV